MAGVEADVMPVCDAWRCAGAVKERGEAGRRWEGAWQRWGQPWKRHLRGPRTWRAPLWAQRSTLCRLGRNHDHVSHWLQQSCAIDLPQDLC